MWLLQPAAAPGWCYHRVWAVPRLEGVLCPCEPPLAHLAHPGAGLACPCLLPPHACLLPFVGLLPRLWCWAPARPLSVSCQWFYPMVGYVMLFYHRVEPRTGCWGCLQIRGFLSACTAGGAKPGRCCPELGTGLPGQCVQRDWLHSGLCMCGAAQLGPSVWRLPGFLML